MRERPRERLRGQGSGETGETKGHEGAERLMERLRGAERVMERLLELREGRDKWRG